MTRTARARVTAEIKYGPVSLGSPNDSAKFPEGSIKFGPETAPIVDPQTTNESCLARFSFVARSIAANLA